MKRKILIVDDEKGIRDLFCYLLEPEGFRVFTAKDGMEAIEMIKNNSFEIVFLDVHMPRMRGPEAFKMIKQIRPDQIVIIFSSSSDPDFAFENEAKKYGAFECIYKPVIIEDILNVIERALGGRKGDL